jgi:S1-C subfamily serine protease
LVAPSALSLLLLNSEDASSTASASTTVATDMDTTVEVMENNANIIQMLDQPSSTPQQINTAISSSTSASSRGGGGVLCADVEETSRIAIFERVAPSVVYIDTFSEKRDVFSTNVLEVPVGSGSGFIWDKNGHIVTNFHVIQEAKSAQVAILTSGGGGGGASSSTIIQPAYTSVRPGALGINGSTVLPNYTRVVYKAKVIGVDPTKDIAVLKVEDTDAPILGDLRPIEVGTSTGLRVGQGSLAIGNPFGLDHTLT